MSTRIICNNNMNSSLIKDSVTTFRFHCEKTSLKWLSDHKRSLSMQILIGMCSVCCSVCEVEITPVIDNTFEFPAFDARNPLARPPHKLSAHNTSVVLCI